MNTAALPPSTFGGNPAVAANMVRNGSDPSPRLPQDHFQQPQQALSPASLDSLFDRELGEDERVYLRSLLTLPLEQLAEEPKRLRQQAQALQEQVTDLSVARYGYFVDSVESVVQTHEAAEHMHAQTGRMIESLERLVQRCGEFTGQNKLDLLLQNQQHLNQILAERQLVLLEFLEIPQLMDACIRNGRFDEALDLEQVVRQFHTANPGLSLVASVLEEAEAALRLALRQLLEELSRPIDLMACLKIMAVIRRMDVFSEGELRSRFLECRDQSLNGIIRGIAVNTATAAPALFGMGHDASSSKCDSDMEAVSSAGLGGAAAADPRQHRSLHAYSVLSKVLDVTRVNVFQVVTQYRAIFVDDDSQPDVANANADPHKDLLFYWISHRIQLLLSTIRRSLKFVAHGHLLANLFDQCLYCGLSLSRAGVDFRGLVAPLFEGRVAELYTQAMDTALTQFREALEGHELFIPMQTLLELGIPVSNHAELVEYPSLSGFAQAFVEVVNSLRHCALLNVSTAAEQATVRALGELVADLQTLRLQHFEDRQADALLDASPLASTPPTPAAAPSSAENVAKLITAADRGLVKLVRESLAALFAKPLELEREFDQISSRLRALAQ